MSRHVPFKAHIRPLVLRTPTGRRQPVSYLQSMVEYDIVEIPPSTPTTYGHTKLRGPDRIRK